MSSLTDKVCIVAGAGKGVGRAAACEFAKAGASVALVARRKEVLDETRALLERTGARSLAIPADLSSEQAAEKITRKVVEHFGRIDGLFCCTGAFLGGDLAEMNADKIESLMRSNFSAQYYATKAAAHFMKDRKSGAIVLTSAVFGTAFSARKLSAYSATKAACLSAALSMAADLRDFNVRVNVICPGTVSHHFDPGRRPKERILGKGPAWPEDVARAALFLLSDDAFWISGATLNVDGGFSVTRDAW